MRSALMTRPRVSFRLLRALEGGDTTRITNFHLLSDDAPQVYRLGTDRIATLELFGAFTRAYNSGLGMPRDSFIQTTICPVASERFARDSQYTYGNHLPHIDGCMRGYVPETIQIHHPENTESMACFAEHPEGSGSLLLCISFPEIIITGRERALFGQSRDLVTIVDSIMLTSTGEITIT